MKIRPTWTDFFFHVDGRTDGQTDMTKVIGAFHDSPKAPNNGAGDSKMLICGNVEKFGNRGQFLLG